ncbi:MAG: ferrous iron transport protein A [Holosporaceae bacterium]|jgi:Fe2+ transport system protein FeoA|nr:ferrous iron transport protein A [Holosporaceae bacterium]
MENGTLYDLAVGNEAKIADFFDENVRELSEKFGLFCGKTIKCVSKYGPIIIENRFQTMALGKDLASKIYIEKPVQSENIP